MARLIDADALIESGYDVTLDEVFPDWHELPDSTKEAVCKHGQYLKRLINDQPTVDAVPVVHGRWVDVRGIPSVNRKNVPVVKCSKCEIYFCDLINNHHYMYHYCPNCGAKMDLEVE